MLLVTKNTLFDTKTIFLQLTVFELYIVGQVNWNPDRHTDGKNMVGNDVSFRFKHF